MVTLEDLRAHLDEVVRAIPIEEIPKLMGLLHASSTSVEIRVRAAQLHRADPASDPDQLMTVRQAAEFLSMSPSYVETMIRQGKLKSVVLPGSDAGGKEIRRARVGRARRIRRRDIVAFLDANHFDERSAA
jgi:excisionase family DNA binding protein